VETLLQIALIGLKMIKFKSLGAPHVLFDVFLIFFFIEIVFNSTPYQSSHLLACSLDVFPPKLSQIYYFNIQCTPLSTHVCSLLPNAKPPLPTITKEHFTVLLASKLCDSFQI
jgi:hypothetical protein